MCFIQMEGITIQHIMTATQREEAVLKKKKKKDSSVLYLTENKAKKPGNNTEFNHVPGYKMLLFA